MNARTGSHARFVHDWCSTVFELPEDWRDVASPGLPGSGALLRSAPVQGVSRPPHTASRDCRTAHPLPVRSRVRLHRNAGSRGKREKLAGKEAGKTMQLRSQRSPAFLSAPPHAAQRAVPGWRGGLGRVGADLASAGSMRPPPSPARHVSTAWLATKHVRQETPRHHTRQAINNTPCQHGTPPQKPAEKHLATTQASPSAPATATKHACST